MTKWLYRIGLVLVVLVVVLVGVLWFSSKRLPEGKSGPEADALARKVEQAVHKSAWDQIAVIQWNYAKRQQHVWDRKRGLSQVIWQKGQFKALFPIGSPQAGLVFHEGKPIVIQAQREKALRRAYAWWANDSFWLNPLAKLFDQGTSRKIVTWEGKPQLLITYTSGGVTPGDSYLYVLDKNYLPIQWLMWVSVLPVKGVPVTFEAWTTLPGGAKISTLHHILTRKLEMTELKTAPSVQALLGHDPFLPLLAPLQNRAQPASSPASSRPVIPARTP